MLGRIKDLLSPEKAEEEVRPEQVQVATCAILLEAAHADDEFSDDERTHIIDVLRRQFNMSTSDAHDLIEEAMAEREHATDMWRFTHLINEGFPKAEKLRIVEEVWRVVYADGVLDGHEDYLMHKLRRLLNLAHSELIGAKMKVLEELRGD